MRNLIGRLQEATEPDRKLDCDIVKVIFGVNAYPTAYPARDLEYYTDTTPITLVPRYTSSLDDAFTLVPEGYDHDRFERFRKASYGEDTYNVLLMPDAGDPRAILRGHGMHKFRCIALCIAALNARQAISEFQFR